MEEYTFASSDTLSMPLHVRMLVQLATTLFYGIMMGKQRQHRGAANLVAIYGFA